MKYQTLIIGCGNIAGKLDSDHSNSSRPPLTHAKAYKRNKCFDLVACIDPDKEKRSKFKSDWGVEYCFSSIEDAISSQINIDVVSVCSPTSYHVDHLKQALSLNPRLVFWRSWQQMLQLQTR